MSEDQDDYARGYEMAKAFYLRRATTLQHEIMQLQNRLERVEALSWEMCPEDGRRVREALNA